MRKKINYAKSYNKEICDVSSSHYIAREIKPRLKYAGQKREIRNAYVISYGRRSK
jgi:hypothetical protein